MGVVGPRSWKQSSWASNQAWSSLEEAKRTEGVAEVEADEDHLMELLSLVGANKITDTTAREILSKLVEKPFSPNKYVKDNKLEAVWTIIPVIVLAVLSAVGGAMGVPEILGGHHWLGQHLSSIIGAEHALHLSHTTEWILMGSSVTIALLALLIAISKYSKQADGEPQTVLGKFLYNKWLVDEFYEKAIVQPLNRFAGFLKEVVEKNVIDGVVNGTGKLVQYGARQTRLMQSGQVGYYILFMVLSIVLLFLIWFNDLAITRFFHNLIQ